MQPETILEGLAFPECPRWHENSLFFSDMHDGAVWRLERGGRASKILEVPEQPAGLGWLPDGTLQVVSMRGRALLRMTPAGLVKFADLSGIATGQTNDMVVDAEGRSYIGNFGFDLNGGETPRPTVLIRVDPDGTVSAACEDVWFPNGALITADGRTLLLAETFAGRITAFDIEVGGARAWVALADAHRIIRVVEGGRVTHDVPLPGRHSYACMLGGPDRRDLYICTAEHHLPVKTLESRSGRIEVLRAEVPGAGLP
jgi:sugar lactone lactonase YvrE